MKKTEIIPLTEDNIPKLSDKTGKTVGELYAMMREADNYNQVRMFFFSEVLVSQDRMWDVIQSFLEQEPFVPAPERKHIRHSWKVEWKSPWNEGDLTYLDQLHKDVGLERLWMASDRREQIRRRGF